jgi:hypothetical protein
MASCLSVTAGYPGGSGIIYDSIVAFRERNMMSNKPHLRPHKKKRQTSRTVRLLVAVLFLAIFALAVALAVTGRYVPHGRFILLRGPSAADGGSVASGALPCLTCGLGCMSGPWETTSY